MVFSIGFCCRFINVVVMATFSVISGPILFQFLYFLFMGTVKFDLDVDVGHFSVISAEASTISVVGKAYYDANFSRQTRFPLRSQISLWIDEEWFSLVIVGRCYQRCSPTVSSHDDVAATSSISVVVIMGYYDEMWVLNSRWREIYKSNLNLRVDEEPIPLSADDVCSEAVRVIHKLFWRLGRRIWDPGIVVLWRNLHNEKMMSGYFWVLEFDMKGFKTRDRGLCLSLDEESFAFYSLIQYLWYRTVNCCWYSWMRRWSSSEDGFSLWYADVLRVADNWISQSLFLMEESIFWILHRLSIDPDWEMANVIQQRKLVFKMGQDVKLPRKITELKLCYSRRPLQQHLPILLHLIILWLCHLLFMYVVFLFYVLFLVILHSFQY